MIAKTLWKDELYALPKMQLRSVIVILLGFCLRTIMADCPVTCECKWKNGKETVICLHSNLPHVPLHLDSGTQVLDLTGNNITMLKNEEFSNAGLLNLQRIYISKCRLKSLQRYVFKNLKNLVELDLSVNLLNAIPSHTFDSISELRELKLNENPIQRITNEAFASLPQLVRLEMSECKITEIESRAFVGLERSLEWLKLDANNLINIQSTSLTRLENLHGLELAGNPWNCSCDLRPLRDWMLKMNVPFGVPPLCQYPQRLAEKSWDKLDLDEFACVPEIFPSHTVTHSVEGKNVTMTCRIAGTPEPNVRWMLRNKVIANLSGPAHASGKKLYVVKLKNDSSDLTIFSADVQDAGVYICSAENKAGKVEASVTLAVSKRPQDQSVSGKVIFVSILIGILLVIGSCLVVCLFSRKKSRVKWRNHECNRDEDYEKIELNHKMSENTNGGVVQRAEISLVNRKNGDYSVVPAVDTDQELDEDETSTLDIACKSTQKEVANEPKWHSPDTPDPGDLHIPRRTIAETRDDFPRITTSKSGTFKKPDMSPVTATFATIPRDSPDGHGTSNNFVVPPVDSYRKKIPDIVHNSSNPFKYNALIAKGSSSEGGSVNDISELFCTLPRKNKRYRSTDSEAPLLTDSRYMSSGGESCGSQDSNSLRRFGDSYRYTVNNLNTNRVNQISNSYLNLCRVDRPTTSQEYKATPLLNVSGLENRAGREIFSPTSGTPNANSYDYHATQLERFLEEYRNLQKQLTKMKETCDNLRQDTNYLRSISRTDSSDDVKKTKRTRSVDVTSPNSNRNFESELTKYLLSKSSSPQPYASSSMFNN